MRAVINVYAEKAAVRALGQSARVKLRVMPEAGNSGQATDESDKAGRMQMFEHDLAKDRIELVQERILGLIDAKGFQGRHGGHGGESATGGLGYGRIEKVIEYDMRVRLRPLILAVQIFLIPFEPFVTDHTQVPRSVARFDQLQFAA